MDEDGNGNGGTSGVVYVTRGEFMEYKERVQAEFSANSEAHDFIVDKIETSGKSIKNAIYFSGGFVTIVTIVGYILSYIGVI